jgi:hypothetical protein
MILKTVLQGVLDIWDFDQHTMLKYRHNISETGPVCVVR